MPIQPDYTVRLDAGQVLGYAEYGDARGTPVLFFHGTPSSRLQVNNPAFASAASSIGCRIIALDRPGIGLSDYQSYTVASWPDIVMTFAKKLGLERFSLMGSSGGGRYVVACAWKIPQYITAAAIISGTCSFDLPGAALTLSQQDRRIYVLADKAPWVFRLLLWKIARDTRTNPASLQSLFNEVAEPDKVLLAQPDVQRMFMEMVQGAFQQGTRGVARDWQLEARPWDIPLHTIRIPIQLWHGEADTIVSIAQARILAQHIPHVEAHYLPEEGHISLFVNHFAQILSRITQ